MPLSLVNLHSKVSAVQSGSSEEGQSLNRKTRGRNSRITVIVDSPSIPIYDLQRYWLRAPLACMWENEDKRTFFPVHGTCKFLYFPRPGLFTSSGASKSLNFDGAVELRTVSRIQVAGNCRVSLTTERRLTRLNWKYQRLVSFSTRRSPTDSPHGNLSLFYNLISSRVTAYRGKLIFPIPICLGYERITWIIACHTRFPFRRPFPTLSRRILIWFRMRRRRIVNRRHGKSTARADGDRELSETKRDGAENAHNCSGQPAFSRKMHTKVYLSPSRSYILYGIHHVLRLCLAGPRNYVMIPLGIRVRHECAKWRCVYGGFTMSGGEFGQRTSWRCWSTSAEVGRKWCTSARWRDVQSECAHDSIRKRKCTKAGWRLCG